ncbi:class I SAM-dependent RNA methyltransferase [Alteriqipengyuania lutimaris]|uniref:Class I SAM-dependent RNA methyltransferase n=1 Tax=Alteriqipengyuania lutimaris TaxID=1538146 RepID=A0A395LMB8_9SPHN|nr:class I SAM-dependent RNA methyltransferase [Alteriqipengyuania lutimaris]MBB3032745.1 23S rRNA (uracil1939-C5)-methyltransferase [Alteriqipengyuania lutimaris]RDS78148.1 class I SAM-dependent RNA methyltransferase [Alteriqipengyuania lutimaris]
MSQTGQADPVVRIAAKGDGLTEGGRHVAGAVPGDAIDADGEIIPGPHHVDPPCRHFPQCGGCELQHADDAALAQFVSERVRFAAESQGLEPEVLAPPHLSPPRSRRRATLHVARIGKKIVIGFREGGSHRIVDMAECHILSPELFALVAPLRALLGHWQGKLAADIQLTRIDSGVAVEIKGIAPDGLAQTEALLDFAREQGLARLSIDEGYGPEPVWEPSPAMVTIGGVPVAFPHGAFLQPTSDGEAALVSAAKEWCAGHGVVADLFAGLGTFAFALGGPGKVLAAEADRAAHLACQAAARQSGRPVHALHRDLFRDPLTAAEISKFGAILLDPPRAGARSEVDQIAQSTATRVAYISCNPQSWARDARRLADAGFRLAELRPVGQFRWSTHVELASLFLRD